MAILRHKLIITNAAGGTSTAGAACNCGYDPAVILEAEGKDVFWAVTVREVINHVRKSRHWKYLGVEFHYGFGYYIWENQLNSKRHAVLEAVYLTLTGVSRQPRMELNEFNVQIESA